MVKHAQTIRRQKPTNCLSVFDHFVGLALKGLRKVNIEAIRKIISPVCEQVNCFTCP